MIKTLNPYSTTAETAEIMSRYRPIAPKPEVPANSIDENSALSQKTKQSPYLRNLWPQLQARPTRSRKRGRVALSPTTLKRSRTRILGLPSTTLSLHGFSHEIETPKFSYTPSTSLVTLPLLPCCMEPIRREKVTDLNKVAEIPEEKDFLKLFQGPPSISSLVTPQPILPVGSSIFVGCINKELSVRPPPMQVPKKPGEIEDDIEAEALPVLISDSNNKVRLANSAYKELVGQPECPWLDSISNSSKRICGEVTLNLSDSRVPLNSKGFSCLVRIEWGNEGNNNKGSITTFCDVVKLSCLSKDYLFTWRFHTHNREASQSHSNL
ncbi:NADH-ubiquinone oxidoreductase-related-like protein [Hibiscus syriacus]|uniref:NADH-ubiquinone oxidoreductase-related-like protein n=1 Tax=Hibiscus syriacus TaxID=106335 RepID=A0A6A2WYU3_HIBSY|nr:NADH-ubiquinone oxidoreductase-related-like protein [Hibiscus syriacus]